MPKVTGERWSEAQSAEALFWSRIEPRSLLRICTELVEFVHQIGDERLSSLFDGKAVLEVGCGPLGISLASLYAHKQRLQRLVKADPLPRLKFENTLSSTPAWAEPLIAWADQLSTDGDYVQLAGEEMAFRDEFDTVISHNVIDHVRDPLSVLKACHTALKSGGDLFLSVDCFSVLGRLRFEHITRRLYSTSILVRAHPHSFVPQDVPELMNVAGFCDIKCLTSRSRIDNLAGHSFHASFVGKKN